MPYLTPAEVAQHNVDTDIWVSFLGRVRNLTPLIAAHKNDVLAKPIIAAAGTDISHWFDERTGDLRTHCDVVTGLMIPFTPRGRVLHVPPPFPSAAWATNFGLPWWRDDRYVVGTLTAKARRIRVVNMLTSQELVLEVCSEETISEIQERYRKYNAHTGSYTWKSDGRVIQMDQTLAANGIPDEDPEFHRLAIDDTQPYCIPELHVYFNDDLTDG